MMYLNRHNIAHNALTLFNRTEAPEPPELKRALEHRDQVRELITASVDKARTLPATIVAAVKAGKEPTNAPDVRQAEQAALWMDRAGASLTMMVDDLLTQAVADNADAMVTAMRPAFDNAANALVESHKVLGNVDLDDARQILSLGRTAKLADAPTAAWAAAQDAVRIITEIMDAWNTIALTANWWETSPHAGMVEWDAERWVDTHHSLRHAAVGDPWQAVRNGWTLRLASAQDLTQLETTVAEAEERQRQAVQTRQFTQPPGSY